MIQRNTTIPTQKKEIYSTASDSQPSVEIHVLQGERAEARYNRTLGRFHLDGIPPAPRGIPKVEVTFDIDANGILSVTAKDMATGKDQRITITANSGLADGEIDRMVKEAKDHEADDKLRRDQVERRNRLDNLAYQLEKQIADNKDKLQGADLSNIERLLKEGREALEKQDDTKVQSILEELEREAHAMASKMYEAAGGGPGDPGAPKGNGAQGQGPGAPPTDGGGKKGEVIDAEFEEGA
jgi:molecular chaperone DnaK